MFGSRLRLLTVGVTLVAVAANRPEAWASSGGIRCSSVAVDAKGRTSCVLQVRDDRPKEVDLARTRKAKPPSRPPAAPVPNVRVVEAPPPVPNAVIRGFPVALGPCEQATALGTIEPIPNCDPTTPNPAPPPPTPDQYAQAMRAELETLAPKPILTIAPGWALVGRYAYLETNGNLTFTNNNQVIAWTCAVATSTANWGDGTTQTINRTTTGPWPNGSARHAYINARNYQVTVRETWSCAIDTPTGATTLALNTLTPPLDLRADEIQAIGIP